MLERVAVILSFIEEKPNPSELAADIESEFETENSLAPEDVKNKFLEREEIEDLPDKLVEYLESELGNTHRIETPEFRIEVSPWGVRISGESDELDSAADTIGEILEERGIEYETEEENKLTLDNITDLFEKNLDDIFGDDISIGSFQVKGDEGHIMVNPQEGEISIRGDEKILKKLDELDR